MTDFSGSSQYQPRPLSACGETFSPKGRIKKEMSVWGGGGLKESLPKILAWGRGAYCVSCQKRLCKMKYGIEGSIFK